METISITLLCTIAGAIVGYLTFQRNTKSDVKQDTRDSTSVAVKLDYISKGVDDIRLDIKSANREIDSLKEKYIRVDESTKQAHKRLDKIEGGK